MRYCGFGKKVWGLCLAVMLLAISSATASELVVRQEGDLLHVSNTYYEAAVNLKAGAQLSSFKRKGGPELLAFYGAQAAGNNNEKAFWTSTQKNLPAPIIKRSPDTLTITSFSSLLDHRVRQTITFRVKRESVELRYEVLDMKQEYGSAELILPSINLVERFDTVYYPVSETGLQVVKHDMKDPKTNIGINTPGNWFAVTDGSEGLIAVWETFPPEKGVWWCPVFHIRWVYSSKPMVRFVSTKDAASKVGIDNRVHIAAKSPMNEVSIQARNLLENELGVNPLRDEDLVTWADPKHLYAVDAPAGLEVLWAPATEKLRMGATFDAASREKKPIALSAARNEMEGVQLLLSSSEPLGVIDAKLTQGNLPASWVNLYRMSYPTVAQPDDRSISSKSYPARWPDGLMDLQEQEDLPSILQDKQGAIWVAIEVPEDATPGLYQGEVSIQVGGKSMQVPLTLRVWDFALPRTPTFKVLLPASFKKAYQFAGQLDPRATIEDYIEQTARHRMFLNAGGLERELDGKPLLFQEFASKQPVTSLGLAMWLGQWGKMRDLNGHPHGTPGYFDAIRKQLLDQKAWFDANPVKQEVFIYSVDEPAGNEYEQVMACYRVIRENWPEVKIILTEKFTPFFASMVNVWCTPSYEVEDKDVQAIHADGAEAWFYTCLSERYPYPTLRIDRPGDIHRILGWLAWRYKLDGYLYWGSNEWSDNANDRGLRYHTAGAYAGDGYLFYPDLQGGKLNPSLRLFQLRDGLEDFEYLRMIDALAAKGNSDAIQILKDARQGLTSFKEHNLPAGRMLELREKMGQLLSQTAGQ